MNSAENTSNEIKNSNNVVEKSFMDDFNLLEAVRRRFQGKDIGRQFWMPDSTSISCFDCETKFTAIRRRHHCRICGQIFCNSCCNEMIDAKLILSQDSSKIGLLRVCKYCSSKIKNLFNEKSKYNKSKSELNKQSLTNSSILKRKLSTSSIGDIVRFAKSNLDNSDVIVSFDKNEISDASPADKTRSSSSAGSSKHGLQFIIGGDESDSSMLSCSFDDIRTMDMLKEIDESITAREPIWVKEIVNEEAKLRETKRTLLEDKENNNVIIDKLNKNIYFDQTDGNKYENMIKKSKKQAYLTKTEIIQNKISPNRINDALVDLERFLCITVMEATELDRKIEDAIAVENTFKNIKFDKSELPMRTINAIYNNHSQKILIQILNDKNISLDWLPVLNDIAIRIVDTIKLPQYSYLYSIDNYYQNNDSTVQFTNANIGPYSMDIRKRVKIKSILNGTKADCTIINGFVFNKNVAHKKMRTNIDEPRILLFACSIGYDERRRSKSNITTAFKLTLFDSMLLQESNYIGNVVAKIEMLKPDIILVEGTVSQTALEILLEKNITVVLNVKRSILDRLSFLINTEIIHSPEMILSTIKVGTCKKFHLQEYIISQSTNPFCNKIYFKNKKTLLFLEGFKENNGVSVLLRGSKRFSEFKLLKNVLRYILFVHYNNRLEKAFHQILNCMPIAQELECNSLIEFYQKHVENDLKMSTIKMDNSENDNLIIIGEKKSKLTIIEDFSDPLRSALNDDDKQDDIETINDHKDATMLKIQLNSQKLEKILDNIHLSISPCVKFNAPFLLDKNIHKISSLRFYFPIELLPSERLSNEVSKNDKMDGEIIDKTYQQNKDDEYANYSFLFEQNSKNESVKLMFINLLTNRYMVVKPHPFLINDQYNFNVKSQEFVSDFRSCGPYSRYAPNFFNRKSTLNDSIKSTEKNEIGAKIESLSNQEHQNISVLFSVFSLQSEMDFNYCFKPKIFNIHYYGQNDMSLGSFLLRHFFFRQTRFNQQSTMQNNIDNSMEHFFDNNTAMINRKMFCPNENCSISMFKHLMRFVHSNGTITIYLNQLNDTRHMPLSHQILTRIYCNQCQIISDYVEMSPESLAISFGKFLELKFYGDRYFNYEKFFLEDNNESLIKCRHSIHKSSYQFFFYDQLAVIFKYEPIGIYEIVTPSSVIPITRNHFSKIKLIDELKLLTEQCHEVFSKVKNEIETLKSYAEGKSLSNYNNTQNVNIELINVEKLDEFLLIVQQEELDFVKRIKDMHNKLSLLTMENANVITLFNLDNNCVSIKKTIGETVLKWNDRFKEFFLELQSRNKRSNPDNIISSFVNRFLSNDSQNETRTELKNNENNDDNKSDMSALSNQSFFETNLKINDNVDLTINDNSVNNEKSPVKLNTMKSKVISKITSDNDSSTSFTSKIFTRNTEEIPFVIEMPFANNNNNNAKQNQAFVHYQLPTFKDFAIIVRDCDPGSIIAYSLTTPEYERKLKLSKSLIGDLQSDQEKLSTDLNSNKVIINCNL